jgi:hypothetical protein
MTKIDIQKMIKELPNNDPEFVIGWLIAQLETTTRDLEIAYAKLEQFFPLEDVENRYH